MLNKNTIVDCLLNINDNINFLLALSWAIASTVTALVFMPKFREMNFTSAYEYLEKRFDRSVRMCASFAFSFGM
ncbi:unnamed protein product, partial [Rotaria sp. Silwood1]